MAEQGTRKGYANVPAVNPKDGSPWDLYISLEKLQYITKRGMAHAKELAFVVPKVLLAPKAIFVGVRDELEDNWLCYVGRPAHSYRGRKGDPCPPWPGEVYLVFVTSDHVIYTFRWEKAAEDNPDLPENYSMRFRERAL